MYCDSYLNTTKQILLLTSVHMTLVKESNIKNLYCS